MPAFILQWCRAVLLPGMFMLLASCAGGFGPPSGWVAKDPATRTGVFVYSDGSRYEGGYSGNVFHGRGTVFYEYAEDQRYVGSSDAAQLAGSQLNAEFSNGALVRAGVKYKTRWNDARNNMPSSAFIYEGSYDGGFTGQGKVLFQDGRSFEGVFGNEATLYAVAPGDRVVFHQSTMIGSYFEGPGVMRWRNGATFEGVVYRYYLFDRNVTNPDNLYCVSSEFFGNGLLKEPGKPDYVGLVGETYEKHAPVHASEKAFIAYAEELAACPGTLAQARNRINGVQAQIDDEMQQGRDNARAMLAADLGNLGARISYDMARVDAASRGTTLEIEEASRQNNAGYQAFLNEQDADPGSDRNKRKAEAARRQASAVAQAEQERQRDAAQAARAAVAKKAAREDLGAQEREVEQLAETERLRQHQEVEQRAAQALALERQAREQQQQLAAAAQHKAEQERLAEAEQQKANELAEQARRKAEEIERALPEALAFCWQSDKGYWFCDGPGDETSIGEPDLDVQLSGIGCDSPSRMLKAQVTLTSVRVAGRGNKSGWLYRCGEKLKVGDTGHATWNRDIRRFWKGIPQ